MELYNLLLQKLYIFNEYIAAVKTSALEGDEVSLILVISFFLIVTFILVQILQMLLLLLSSPEAAKPYSRPRVGGKRILIVGDSTAVGTGAASYEYTLAGRFASDFPKADILNLGVNGSTTHGVLSQLKKVKDQSFDLVVLVTGGNDIWTFSTFWGLTRTLRLIFETTAKMSKNKAVVLFYGANGSSNFIPLLFRGLFLMRTKEIQKAFTKVTEEEGIPLVELFTTDSNNPFLEDPKAYFSSDCIHPSDLGYWVWYKKMWSVFVEKKMPIFTILQD